VAVDAEWNGVHSLSPQVGLHFGDIISEKADTSKYIIFQKPQMSADALKYLFTILCLGGIIKKANVELKHR
jgi:hypothetical protein